MEMVVRYGDIASSNAKIIVQVTNCRGVVCGDTGLSIWKRWPDIVPKYQELCSEKRSGLMGMTQFLKTTESPIIANCFAQNGFGTWQPTDLDALRAALEVVRDVAASTEAEVAIPYMIGCGHDGGDWAKVSEVIGEVFRNHPSEIELWRPLCKQQAS